MPVLTLHREKRLTGYFRIARCDDGELAMQVEVEVEQVTGDDVTTYRAYRRATIEDCEAIRIKERIV